MQTEVLQQPLSLKTITSGITASEGLVRVSSQGNMRDPTHMVAKNRFHFSPEYKKTGSPNGHVVMNGCMETERGRNNKLDNILFTIEENYYFRKNANNQSPRPPKYRGINTRPSLNLDVESSESGREKKVIFTDNPINDKRSLEKKESFSNKSIIRNNSKDNLSVSSVLLMLSSDPYLFKIHLYLSLRHLR